MASFNKNQKWCNIIIYTRTYTLYPYTLLYSSHTFKCRRIIRPPIPSPSPPLHLATRSSECDILFALWIPPQKPGGLYHDPNDPHLRARRLASQTTYSWTAWIYLETIGTHTCIYIIHIYIRIYMLARTHVHPSSSRVLWAGDVTWLPIDSLSVVVVGILRDFRFLLGSATTARQHPLLQLSKIPITCNRILTHVYKYLNAFIIHIYIHRRLGVFSPAYTCTVYRPYTHTPAFSTLMLRSWKEENVRIKRVHKCVCVCVWY